MTAKDGNIIERGVSFRASHVLSFKKWEVFVAVYLNKTYPELTIEDRKELLKKIYVYALMNPCLVKEEISTLNQPKTRSKCHK